MTVSLEMFDKENDGKRPTVMVSGGFDPVHVGILGLFSMRLNLEMLS